MEREDLRMDLEKIIPIEEIEDAFLYQRKIHGEDRGNFSELIGKKFLETQGQPFVQQNQSFSYGGVLRGMHFQERNPQGKLVTAAYGAALDVMLDLREE